MTPGPPRSRQTTGTPFCRASIGMRAKVKMLWNISIIMPTKISVPQTLCVSVRSSLSLKFSPGTADSVVTARSMAATPT